MYNSCNSWWRSDKPKYIYILSVFIVSILGYSPRGSPYKYHLELTPESYNLRDTWLRFTKRTNKNNFNILLTNKASSGECRPTLYILTTSLPSSEDSLIVWNIYRDYSYCFFFFVKHNHVLSCILLPTIFHLSLTPTSIELTTIFHLSPPSISIQFLWKLYQSRPNWKIDSIFSPQLMRHQASTYQYEKSSHSCFRVH